MPHRDPIHSRARRGRDQKKNRGRIIRYVFTLLLAVSFLGFHQVVSAATGLTCNGCPDNEMYAKSIRWADENIADSDSSIEQVIIPEDVLPNAWAYVNCAYCSRDISDYLRRKTPIEQLAHSVEALMQTVGVLKAKNAGHV